MARSQPFLKNTIGARLHRWGGGTQHQLTPPNLFLQHTRCHFEGIAEEIVV